MKNIHLSTKKYLFGAFRGLFLYWLLFAANISTGSLYAQTAMYIDENGVSQTATEVATHTTGGSQTLGSADAATWYMLSGSRTFTGLGITVETVHLILEDGCNWTVTGSDNCGVRVLSGNSMAIYALSNVENEKSIQ